MCKKKIIPIELNPSVFIAGKGKVVMQYSIKGKFMMEWTLPIESEIIDSICIKGSAFFLSKSSE